MINGMRSDRFSDVHGTGTVHDESRQIHFPARHLPLATWEGAISKELACRAAGKCPEVHGICRSTFLKNLLPSSPFEHSALVLRHGSPKPLAFFAPDPSDCTASVQAKS